ncbi:hypothetical protein KPL39_15350 [Clostridium gasigenes]|uniref:hypothetical protein n=1 Tax=Clostridium gasigenes TaxID=94869 RepID=UPI001C0B7B18|nr:hypothetical protein [Clostridium gasigenes]MBU3137638.1 hypothetical protein [Clostridium gasigenes]
MELIMEFVFEVILEGVNDVWIKFMKKRNPDYDSNKSKKVFTKIIGIILILLTVILIFAIFVVIEWILPKLFNVVRLD